MNYRTRNACAICGEEQQGHETRFLVAENRWEDKLTILEWNQRTAARAGVQVACGINHVEELVIHWMTTGSLDYPFARVALGSRARQRPAAPDFPLDLSGARLLGELAIDRGSVERVLAENPQSLQVILDALVEALERDTVRAADQPVGRKEAVEEEQACVGSSKA
jgi:hypothetical protein